MILIYATKEYTKVRKFTFVNSLINEVSVMKLYESQGPLIQMYPLQIKVVINPSHTVFYLVHKTLSNLRNLLKHKRRDLTVEPCICKESKKKNFLFTNMKNSC